MSSEVPIYGLVVCGGKSTRMGRDKSLIDYHGKPQRYYLYDLLNHICGRAFISCNEEQVSGLLPYYNLIVDNEKFGDIGPMKALLSAIELYPESSFLLVGCDYPFISEGQLYALFKTLLQAKKSVCYKNINSGLIEPLISGYHIDILHKIKEQFQLKNYSLRRLLEQIDVVIIEPDTPEILRSVDDEDGYKTAWKALRKSI